MPSDWQPKYTTGQFANRTDGLWSWLGPHVRMVPSIRAQRLVTLALQSGRARALYGPGGEQALLRLYRRLPGGTEARESAAAVSEALAQLNGKPLERAALTAVGPGSHSLALEAGGLRLLVHLDRNGARLASVETSG